MLVQSAFIIYFVLVVVLRTCSDEKKLNETDLVAHIPRWAPCVCIHIAHWSGVGAATDNDDDGGGHNPIKEAVAKMWPWYDLSRTYRGFGGYDDQWQPAWDVVLQDSAATAYPHRGRGCLSMGK